jgi:RHS repeat-associated protein
MHRDPIGIDTEFQSLVGRYYDPATDQFLSVDPDVAETGQPYAFTGDNPVNRKDPLGLYITGGGSSECNRSSDGTLYCTGSTSNGQSVTGSLNTSTGVTTGAFTPASELTDSLADQKSAVRQGTELLL